MSLDRPGFAPGLASRIGTGVDVTGRKPTSDLSLTATATMSTDFASNGTGRPSATSNIHRPQTLVTATRLPSGVKRTWTLSSSLSFSGCRQRIEPSRLTANGGSGSPKAST